MNANPRPDPAVDLDGERFRFLMAYLRNAHMMDALALKDCLSRGPDAFRARVDQLRQMVAVPL